MEEVRIVKLGHPALRKKAVAIEENQDCSLLIGHMREALAKAGGVGLAAPQIAENYRVILAVDHQGGRESLDKRREPIVLINPLLTPADDAVSLDFEGCLSIPHYWGLVPRYQKVVFQALDESGKEIEGVAEGFFARVLQHEVDHLDGVLYLDRLPDLDHLTMEEEKNIFVDHYRKRMLS